MDETESLSTELGPRRPGEPSWYAVLAFDAGQPDSGAQRFALDGVDELVVGRGEARGVAREGRTVRLALDDRFLSKDHFRIRRTDDAWQLEDAGSKNGTRCRGQRTTSLVLVAGDVIEAGAAFFVIGKTASRVTDGLARPQSSRMLHTLHGALGAELALLERLAPSKLPLLVRGESGTGKEVAARTIHTLSKRRGPLVAVNCGAMPASIAEAELFGAKRGAFSGAVDDRPGLIRGAEHGTLFLDEIADLPPPAQTALLRFLQEGEVRALGADKSTTVDVRVVAATHRDLEALVAKDAFRHDLAARLRGHVLSLPPLRERREDLGILCTELLDGKRLDRAAARAIFAYGWPSNIRELGHALHYATAKATGDITAEDLPDTVRTNADPAPPEGDQRTVLVALLSQHEGNVSAVARALHTSRSQIRRLIARYGLTVAAEPDSEPEG